MILFVVTGAIYCAISYCYEGHHTDVHVRYSDTFINFFFPLGDGYALEFNITAAVSGKKQQLIQKAATLFDINETISLFKLNIIWWTKADDFLNKACRRVLSVGSSAFQIHDSQKENNIKKTVHVFNSSQYSKHDYIEILHIFFKESVC